MDVRLWPPPSQVFVARNRNVASPGSFWIAPTVSTSCVTLTPLRVCCVVVDMVVLLCVGGSGHRAARQVRPVPDLFCCVELPRARVALPRRCYSGLVARITMLCAPNPSAVCRVEELVLAAK